MGKESCALRTTRVELTREESERLPSPVHSRRVSALAWAAVREYAQERPSQAGLKEDQHAGVRKTRRQSHGWSNW